MTYHPVTYYADTPIKLTAQGGSFTAVLLELQHNSLFPKDHGAGDMNLAYKYQNTFDDTLAEEFRQILSLPPKLKLQILQVVPLVG